MGDGGRGTLAATPGDIGVIAAVCFRCGDRPLDGTPPARLAFDISSTGVKKFLL